MYYAPVVIPTLNRYNHFIKCMESLNDNTWAQFTDVYISVDYPPNETYYNGYQNIIGYLNERKFRFKNTYVYIQKENLGPAFNMQFLREKVFEAYDRVICIEDDYEFSSSFLEYMNKSMEYAEHDKNIFGVCAYQPSISRGKGTIYKSQAISWGTGIYKGKYEDMVNKLSKEWIESFYWDYKAMSDLFLNSKRTFFYFFYNYLQDNRSLFYDSYGKVRTIDIIKEMYLRKENMYVIFPTMSKLKNNGFDGSGVNCGKSTQRINEIEKLEDEDCFFLIEETDRGVLKRLRVRASWAGVEHQKKEVYSSFVVYSYLWLKKMVRKHLK